jgi:hypothetical protein
VSVTLPNPRSAAARAASDQVLDLEGQMATDLVVELVVVRTHASPFIPSRDS